MLTLSIDRKIETPVYEQVADQLRQLVASGDLPPGMVLPPVRQLASDLGVNLNTIARAYRLLEAEGFLVILERTGVRVAEAGRRKIDESEIDALIGELRRSLSRLRQAGMSAEELLGVVHREMKAFDFPGEDDE